MHFLKKSSYVLQGTCIDQFIVKMIILIKDKFVCLLWSLLSHSRIFHSYGDVTIAGKGLQILTYAQHL